MELQDILNNYPKEFNLTEYYRSDVKKVIYKLLDKLHLTDKYKNDNDKLIILKKQLTSFLKQVKKGSRGFYNDIKYSIDKTKLGRYYAINKISIQSLPSLIRNTLIDKNNYVDFDIVNCAPTILYNICLKKNIDCDYLKYYCDNRNTCLKNLMKEMNVNKKTAKNMFIRLMFGDTFNSFIRDCFNNKKDFNCNFNIDWLKPLFTELNNICNILMNDDEYNFINKSINLKKKNNKYQGIDKSNKKGSFISQLLFTYENYIIHLCYDFITKLGFAVDCFIFDGLIVRLDKLENKREINFICDECSKHIKEKIDFDISFSIKDFNDNYEYLLTEQNNDNNNEEDDEEISLFGSIHKSSFLFDGIEKDNDIQAVEKILTIYPYFKCCNGILYAFDFDTGLWSFDKNNHIKILNDLSPYLRIKFYDKIKDEWCFDKTKTYTNKKKLILDLLDLIPSKCIDNKWITQKQNSSLGMLLFNNGYLDLNNGFNFYSKEKYGFNPNIVFFGKIYKDFDLSKKDDDYINDIKYKLLINPLGEEQTEYFLNVLSRGLFGDITIKKILFGLGVSNSGKNTITNAIKLSLDDYYGTWNAGNLFYNKSSNDEAQKLRWALLLRSKRIIVSNELKSEGCIDGNLLKKVASGGDTLVGRTHNKEEQEFVPHFLPIVYANDLPKISPVDDALKNRTRCITFNKCFVDNPTNDFEMKKDDIFCKEVYEENFQLHFIYLLIQYYINFKQNGFEEPESVINSEWFNSDDDEDLINIFKNNFEITENEEDIVLNKDFEIMLKDKNVSVKKLTIELKRYIKINDLKCIQYRSKKGRGWKGIKAIDNEDEE